MTGLVSVVIPAGRVDDDLAAQLAAVAAQQIDLPFEVVVALNTDDATAAARLDEIVGALDDDSVRAVVATDGRGAAFARNAGAAAAAGEILAFCDSDDIAEPTWLAPLVAALDTFDAVGGRLDDFGLDERQTAVRPPATPDGLPTFLGVPYIVSASMAIPKSLFDAAGGFDESLIRCEDIALSWKLLGQGRRLGYVAESAMRYRHRPGLVPLMRQHFHYGRGMAQVLIRYGIPANGEWSRPRGAGLLRPNAQPGGRRSLAGVLRRGSLAAGRVAGIVTEKLRR